LFFAQRQGLYISVVCKFNDNTHDQPTLTVNYNNFVIKNEFYNLEIKIYKCLEI